MLYISSNETIGLPILEANKHNLIIIAPKLPYSEQFIKPHITFDINKKNDLIECIENFLKNNFQTKKKNKESLEFESNITLNSFFEKVL